MKTYLKVIVPRSGYDDNVVHFEQDGSFNGTNKTTGCIQQLLSAARGFYLLNAKVQLYYNNVGKNWYTQTRFYRFVKAISA